MQCSSRRSHWQPTQFWPLAGLIWTPSERSVQFGMRRIAVLASWFSLSEKTWQRLYISGLLSALSPNLMDSMTGQGPVTSIQDQKWIRVRSLSIFFSNIWRRLWKDRDLGSWVSLWHNVLFRPIRRKTSKTDMHFFYLGFLFFNKKYCITKKVWQTSFSLNKLW